MSTFNHEKLPYPYISKPWQCRLYQYKSANQLLLLHHFTKTKKANLILVTQAMSKCSSIFRKMGLLRTKEKQAVRRPSNYLSVWWKRLSNKHLDRRFLDYLDEIFFRLAFAVRYVVEGVVLVSYFCWFFVRFGFRVWQMLANHELYVFHEKLFISLFVHSFYFIFFQANVPCFLFRETKNLRILTSGRAVVMTCILIFWQ